MMLSFPRGNYLSAPFFAVVSNYFAFCISLLKILGQKIKVFLSTGFGRLKLAVLSILQPHNCPYDEPQMEEFP